MLRLPPHETSFPTSVREAVAPRAGAASWAIVEVLPADPLLTVLESGELPV